MDDLTILQPKQYDYFKPGLPTLDVNPDKVGATWLALSIGILFVCIDNTTDANIWRGSNGQYIEPVPSDPWYQQGIYSGGTATDISGNGRNCTVVSGKRYDAFNETYGEEDGVYMLTSTQTTGCGSFTGQLNFTLSSWVSLTDTPSGVLKLFGIGTWPNNGSMLMYANGSSFAQGVILNVDNNQVGVGSVFTSAKGPLQHVCMVRDEDAHYCYINGVLRGTSGGTVSPTQTMTGNITMGQNSSNKAHWCADTRIFTRALSATEVLALYRLNSWKNTENKGTT